ncbi:NADH dehydrogenase [Aquipluma nitroreducens]|uniref:NADH:ubiquinone reductase (non-electrogenic) n=1 Tax=Aquipluma nitroreducens TaxID=2010828 RepID=A0A5K7S5V8_9BACT|nr:NAD(P)/FAD-dependent oxidoreductase [Aquipluma nitroreducens]BBE16887.1 NADH dehydrogenase [Aquipluma nitroreducens]
MSVNIPETAKKRIVIIGAGFGGLKLAKKLVGSGFQIVLIDKNNYHQFQPLFYQVASSGIEPSSILFPLRKIFQKRKDVYIRVAEVHSVDTEKKELHTSLDVVWYDYLVIATGVNSNFFGMKNLEQYAIPMKSVSEAMFLRNRILSNLEKAVTLFEQFEDEKRALLNVVVVGGGPTGVEIAGAIAEMKNFVLPKDYPDLNLDLMQVSLLEGSPSLLANMSKHASEKSTFYLKRLGVNARVNTRVIDYDGEALRLGNGEIIKTKLVIWAAGISGVVPSGIPEEAVGRSRRMLVDEFSKVKGFEDIYAIGDASVMSTAAYPNGHPQVAQVAIQQGTNLANNFKAIRKNAPLKAFKYIDRGSMATIGRNRAVADLPFLKFSGFIAWLTWMFVHLMAIVGVKNRLLIFINWMWNYLTYDQSLRLILWAARKDPSKIISPPDKK